MKFPINKPLRDDGPHCRVCGCTQHRACEGGCAWVREPSWVYKLMPPICTACSGTAEDLAYTMKRIVGMRSWATVNDFRAHVTKLARAAFRRVVDRRKQNEEIDNGTRSARSRRR
jgi:hypothetical protein